MRPSFQLFIFVLLCLYFIHQRSVESFHNSPLLRYSARKLNHQRLLSQSSENVLQHTVHPKDASLRLDTYLSTIYQSYSRSFFGNLCEKGFVSVNMKIQDKAYKIHPGDQISVTIIDHHSHSSNPILPENIPLDILYEDEHILAINKPNGMVVHPAVGSPNGTFVNALLYHLGDNAAQQLLLDSSKPKPSKPIHHQLELDEEEEGEYECTVDLPETPEAAVATPIFLRPGIVHRLDKGTTGVLLAGKHPVAVEKLCKVFAARKVTKTYLAICVGHPGDTTIAEPIGRSKLNRQVMCVTDGITGKDAITHTKTIAFDGKISVVLIRIETGRTHQIRVHLKERRTPIVGDEVYGNLNWNKQYSRLHKISRPMLHAYETKFIHPFTDKPITLVAPLPPDIAEVVESISKKLVTPMNGFIFDSKKRVLLSNTDVPGKIMNAKVVGGTPITSARVYVPSDRLKLEQSEDDWLLENLLEE